MKEQIILMGNVVAVLAFVLFVFVGCQGGDTSGTDPTSTDPGNTAVPDPNPTDPGTAPIFEKSVYNATVNATGTCLSVYGDRHCVDIQDGTTVATVRATDPGGGTVKYAITRNPNNIFSIDAVSGVVTVPVGTKFVRKSYYITVTARNDVPTAPVATARIIATAGGVTSVTLAPRKTLRGTIITIEDLTRPGLCDGTPNCIYSKYPDPGGGGWYQTVANGGSVNIQGYTNLVFKYNAEPTVTSFVYKIDSFGQDGASGGGDGSSASLKYPNDVSGASILADGRWITATIPLTEFQSGTTGGGGRATGIPEDEMDTINVIISIWNQGARKSICIDEVYFK